MRIDTHVHTTFSPDSQSEMSEYAKQVDNGRVDIIGFAEHVDFMPECGAYGFFDYEAFATSIDRFNKKGYRFYAGAEIDYAFKVEQEIREHLGNNSYDYTICSIHMINGMSVSDSKSPQIYKDNNIFKDVIQKYYFEAACGIKTKMFNVLGHAGIYKRYIRDISNLDISILRTINELDDELALFCAKSDILLEVNTSGLFSPCGSVIPDESFLNFYYKYGGRRISLGSDAHSHHHIIRGFAQAYEILKKIGFRYMYMPWDTENPCIIP